MDTGRIVEVFGFSRERIIAKASATEDYAGILAERAVEMPQVAEAWRIRAASAQTIAGSLWMLVRPQSALVPLGRAEAIHDMIGSPYASLLGICAHPLDPAPTQPDRLWRSPQSDRYEDEERERPPKAAQTFERMQPAATLLAHLWPLAVGQTDRSLKQLLSDVPTLRELPDSWLTGRLRIPLGHYRGLATEIDRLRQSERPDARSRRGPLPAASAFLARASEVIGAARENQHQWRTLRSPILPAEPEVLAACTLVEMTTRETLDDSAIELMDLAPDSLASALMGVAQNLLDADSGTIRDEIR